MVADGARILLEARGLTASRRTERGEARVLDGVDLTLAAGAIVDVVGPSGAGKTTLLLALARLLADASGHLALDGVPAEDVPAQAWRRRVALLPQVPALVPGSVGDNLLLPWSLKVRAHEEPPSAADLTRALGGVGLADVAPERSPERLSVGQVARVALLRVLLTRPMVLLADEPDAALDDESAAAVTSAISAFAAEGGAVVRVSHGRRGDLAHRTYRLADGALTKAADA